MTKPINQKVENPRKKIRVEKKEYKFHPFQKELPNTSHLHLRISRLLIRIDMPHNVIRQPVNTVSSSFSHLREALSLCLVFKRIGREIDAAAVDISFDEDVDAANAVQGDLDVLVLAPVAHFGHVGAAGVVLFIA